MKAPKLMTLKSMERVGQWRLWIAVSLLTAGCATAPNQTSTVSPIQAQIAQLANLTGLAQIQQLTDIVQSLNQSGEYQQAWELAQRFEVPADLGQDFVEFKIAATDAAVGAGAFSQALALTDQILDSTVIAPSLDDEIRIIRRRVAAHDGLGQRRDAISELVYLGFIVPEEQESKLQVEIWNRSLQAARDAQADHVAGTSDADGWIELAKAYLEPDAEALRQWRRNWPTHPASDALPSEVAERLGTGWPTPEAIGVILPLSGPLVDVGTNLLDGMIQQQLLDNSIRLVAVDGTQGLQQAVGELEVLGVDMILGPCQNSKPRHWPRWNWPLLPCC